MHRAEGLVPDHLRRRLSVLRYEFGREGRYGAARRAAGSARSGDFRTVLGPGREGKRERDEAPGTGPERREGQ